jgi:protein-S-isoprenylcysteine O-methyltransferase Ste14
VYVFIIVIYGSFLLELVLWPVPSEASTLHLLKKWKSNTFLFNLLYILIFSFNFIFSLAPLVISIYSLVTQKIYEIYPMFYTGIIFSLSGRILSLKGAILLNHRRDQGLITDSIFKWGRNPISLGLYITFLGIVMILPDLWLIAGWIGFVAGMDYKISIEEKTMKLKFGNNYDIYQKSTPKYFLI